MSNVPPQSLVKWAAGLGFPKSLERSGIGILAPRICELGHATCGGSEVLLREDVEILERAGIPVRVYAGAARPTARVTTLRVRTDFPLISSLEYCGQFLHWEQRSLLLSYNEPTVAGLAPGRSIIRFDWGTPLPRYWHLPWFLPRFQGCMYLFPSESGRRHFHNQHVLIPERRGQVLPNAVDLGVFRPVTECAPAGAQVGFAGQFAPGKGITVLLDAWRVVKGQIPSAGLLLAGGTGLWKNVFETPDALPIGQEVSEMEKMGTLSTLGELRRSEMPAFWNALSIAVVPSIAEGFGLVALEALACGVPVVASKVGGLSEIVEHGKSGILVAPNDPRALADALIGLLTNEPLRRQLAAGARERAKAFSLEGRSRSLLEILARRCREALHLA
jgi:glycosyltransferase involved in cell wall biosynthesis